MEVELLAPDVSLVSGLEGVGGLRLQEETGTLWECRKLVGWEQFWKHIPIFMRKKKTFLPLGAFCVHSPWKIRPFAFLWSFWWHSSPTREAAEGFLQKGLSFSTVPFCLKGNTNPNNGTNASLPHCCKQHILKRYRGPVKRSKKNKLD